MRCPQQGFRSEHLFPGRVKLILLACCHPYIVMIICLYLSSHYIYILNVYLKYVNLGFVFLIFCYKLIIILLVYVRFYVQDLCCIHPRTGHSIKLLLLFSTLSMSDRRVDKPCMGVTPTDFQRKPTPDTLLFRGPLVACIVLLLDNFANYTMST